MPKLPPKVKRCQINSYISQLTWCTRQHTGRRNMVRGPWCIWTTGNSLGQSKGWPRQPRFRSDPRMWLAWRSLGSLPWWSVHRSAPRSLCRSYSEHRRLGIDIEVDKLERLIMIAFAIKYECLTYLDSYAWASSFTCLLLQAWRYYVAFRIFIQILINL